MNWIEFGQLAPAIGLNISFVSNSVNLFFGCLVLFIGLGVFTYSTAYMKNYPVDKKSVFYTSLSLFTLAMLGLIFTDNLLLLFLFWEMTSACSFFLIGFKNEKEEVRDKAKWALYTTVGGGLFLLTGIVMASQIGVENGLNPIQSFSLTELAKIEHFYRHDLFSLSFILIFIGLASKSALFPFSFWLPLAMAGPTPVSSFLHSATMVKAGFILAVKLFPLYGDQALWQISFIIIGSLSAFHAAIQCFLQRNLKTMLAYSTSCVLGILAILIGLGAFKAHVSFIVFILAHALYKAALFQIAGYLDSRYKTMDFIELQKFKFDNKLALLTVVLSTLSMVGIPLTMGFYAKEFIYYSALKSPFPILITFIIFFANCCMGIQAINFLRVFWPKKEKRLQTSEVSTLLIIPAFAYSLVATILAIAPGLTNLNIALSAILKNFSLSNPAVTLKLWHGLAYPYNIVILLSVLTILISISGSFLFSKHLDKFTIFSNRYHDFSLWNLNKALLDFYLGQFKKLFSILQNGNLRQYLIITLSTVAGLVLIGLLKVESYALPSLDFTITKALLYSGMLIGLFLTLATSRHYRVLIYFAISGLFIALFFAFHSAMDVSMTQLLVESLSLFFIFFMVKALGFEYVVRTNQLANFFISLFFGLTFLAFYLIEKVNFSSLASNFYKDNSYLLAKGENIVNVILVDFRALDTFGEVIVVTIAIIGVGSLLTKKGGQHE